MRYWPNPAHKRETTEAGPPRWRPDKQPCPNDMTVAERNQLLETSIPDPDAPRPRRFNVRRGPRGLELYEAKLTREVDGEPEFHGHPATRIPNKVLRALRERGDISAAEFGKLRKQQL